MLFQKINSIDKLKKLTVEYMDSMDLNIIQGIRGNGDLQNIYKIINRERNSKVFTYIENIRRNRLTNPIKFILYGILLAKYKSKIDKILYMGNTDFRNWLLSLPSIRKNDLFNFGYYIKTFREVYQISEC